MDAMRYEMRGASFRNAGAYDLMQINNEISPSTENVGKTAMHINIHVHVHNAITVLARSLLDEVCKRRQSDTLNTLK